MKDINNIINEYAYLADENKKANIAFKIKAGNKFAKKIYSINRTLVKNVDQAHIMVDFMLETKNYDALMWLLFQVVFEIEYKKREVVICLCNSLFENHITAPMQGIETKLEFNKELIDFLQLNQDIAKNLIDKAIEVDKLEDDNQHNKIEAVAKISSRIHYKESEIIEVFESRIKTAPKHLVFTTYLLNVEADLKEKMNLHIVWKKLILSLDKIEIRELSENYKVFYDEFIELIKPLEGYFTDGVEVKYIVNSNSLIKLFHEMNNNKELAKAVLPRLIRDEDIYFRLIAATYALVIGIDIENCKKVLVDITNDKRPRGHAAKAKMILKLWEDKKLKIGELEQDDDMTLCKDIDWITGNTKKIKKRLLGR